MRAFRPRAIAERPGGVDRRFLKERRRGPAPLDLGVNEVAVQVHASFEIGLHVVGHGAHREDVSQHGRPFLAGAPKKVTHRSGVIHLDALPDESPPFRKLLCRPRHFEVIDIHTEEQLQNGVEEAALPRGDRHEAHRDKMLLAMPLPIASRVGEAAEGEDERAHRIDDALTLRRPLMPGQPDPGHDRAAKTGLRVGALPIGLLSGMPRKQGVAIARLPRLHGRRGRSEVAEEGFLVVLVADLVPWKTTRPLNFRRGPPKGSSAFVSTQISKIRPTWMVEDDARDSLATCAQGFTLASSHTF
jgi:hypothetical protein